MKVITTAKFRPDGIEDVAWESMSVEQKDETFEWTPICFETNDVESFNKGTNPIHTTVRFKSGEGIQVRLSFQDIVNLFPDAKEL